MPKYEAFISYSHDDGEGAAIELKKTLRYAYLDKYGNRPGAKWERHIREAIRECQIFFFLITPGSIQSDYCQKEWQWALEEQKPIIPVLVEEVDPKKIRPDCSEFYITVHNRQHIEPADAPKWQNYYRHLNQVHALLDRSLQRTIDRTYFHFIDITATSREDAVQRPDHSLDIPTPHDPDTEQESMSIESAWGKYQGQLLLLGEPGAGKTTMLLHHARRLIEAYIANPGERPPFFANISAWPADEDLPIHRWLMKQYQLPEEIVAQIEYGEAMLILDGLDELESSHPIDPQKPEKGTYDPRARFMAQLQPLLERGNEVLITCRARDYEAIGQKFAHMGAVELQPLRDEDIRHYLEHFPELQQTVLDDAALLEICRRPLILSLIAFGYRDAPQEARALGKLEAGELRDTIFRRYVEAVYRYEAERREAKRETMPFALEQIWQVLGHAAMVNASGRRMDLSETTENVLTRKDFEQYLNADKLDAFCALACELYLLQDNQNRSYNFLHLLLRNTFAYPYSIQNLHNEDAVMRSRAAAALGELGDARAVEPLINVLNDEDAAVRYRAVEALGKLGDVRAVESLLAILNNLHEDEAVRSRAAEAFVRFGRALISFGEAALPHLINTLNNEHEWVRSMAAEALGELGDARAVEPLINALNDVDTEVRRKAVLALVELGDARAVEPLINALNDVDTEVHRSALEALVNFGEASLQPLINALNDVDTKMRRKAVLALVELGDARAVEPLINALNDVDTEVRRSALEALVNFGEASLQPLINALNDVDTKMRRKAVLALVELGDARAVEPLINALNDEHQNISYLAALALRKIGTPEALEALKRRKRKRR